jgi:hypothetical protein
MKYSLETIFSFTVLKRVLYLYIPVLEFCKVFRKYKDSQTEMSKSVEENTISKVELYKETSWNFIFYFLNYIWDLGLRVANSFWDKKSLSWLERITDTNIFPKNKFMFQFWV